MVPGVSSTASGTGATAARNDLGYAVRLRYLWDMGFLAWFRWRRAEGLGEGERRALEDWVRRRFQIGPPDPMEAVIGAVGRLTDAGMTGADATDTVLRILREGQAGSEGGGRGQGCPDSK
jgi:hypothetical protein